MSLDNIFRHNNGLRVPNKDLNVQERANYSRWFKEQINMFGTAVTYHPAHEDLEKYDPIYGEDADQSFEDPVDMVMYIELNENALTLSQFGINSDDEVTAFIHVDDFYRARGGEEEAKKGGIEPKSGDLFRLKEYGNDRVFPRDGSIYEITERLDQDIQKINPLMGHYIWLIKAKRYDYSFEGNIIPEGGSTQVDEDTIYDLYSDKDHTYLDLESQGIFDYGDYGGGDSVYGDYY
jgi:hypothetical protein